MAQTTHRSLHERKSYSMRSAVATVGAVILVAVGAIGGAALARRGTAPAPRDSVILASFETRYPMGRSQRGRERNLALAARALDGRWLAPGATLSFNDAVGARTKLAGFVPAPVIDGGEMVDDLGGGICQVASTLHAAALFAGLAIPERHPHTRPSRYLEMGLEAAVAYPRLDLRIQNDLPAPIVLRVAATGGIVRAEIRGEHRLREVTLSRRVVGASPFREQRLLDPRLPAGVRVIAERGIPAMTVERERVVRERGAARRERRVDRYRAVAETVRVGTSAMPRGQVAPPPDDPPWHIEWERSLP